MLKTKVNVIVNIISIYLWEVKSMEMNNMDILKKKLLDAQEMVRDYEMFSKQTDDEEIQRVFKRFAEESGMQASKMQSIIDKYEGFK